MIPVSRCPILQLDCRILSSRSVAGILLLTEATMTEGEDESDKARERMPGPL